MYNDNQELGLIENTSFGVINRGTEWEKRRYLNMCKYLTDYSLQDTFDSSDKARSNVKQLRFGDLIDVALYAVYELGMGYNHKALRLDVSQFGSQLREAWYQGGWKTLTTVAEHLVEENEEMPIFAVFMGPLHNLIQDYEKFHFDIKSRRAQAKFKFKSNRKNYAKLTITFSSQEPSGFTQVVEEFKLAGWTHHTPVGEKNIDDWLAEEQKFTLEIAGDDLANDVAIHGALAAEYLHKLVTIYEQLSAMWTLVSSQVSPFDVDYFAARTKGIIEAHNGDTFLDLLVVGNSIRPEFAS